MAITRVRDVSEERRGRGRPQARPDEETRTVILDSARREFATSGYAATSMESVARGAGVSTKTLYRLIPNKAALFEAMVTDRIDRFVSVINLRGCKGDGIEQALTDALLIYAELILDGEVIALQRAILAESDRLPEIAETFYHKAIQRTEETLTRWLRAQEKRGFLKLDDAGAAAGMLLGMLVFQPQRAVMFGHQPPPTAQERERRARACAKLF